MIDAETQAILSDIGREINIIKQKMIQNELRFQKLQTRVNEVELLQIK